MFNLLVDTTENIGRLEELDQVDEGLLPVEVRPPVMMNCNEASLALHALQEYARLKGDETSSNTVCLTQRLKGYLGLTGRRVIETRRKRYK